MSHVSLEVIQRYLRGESSPAEQAACEGHFSQCATCRAALQAERALVGLLKLDAADSQAAPATGDVDRVLDRVGRAAKFPAPRRNVVWITAAASLVMIALVAAVAPIPADRPPAIAPSGIAVESERAIGDALDVLLVIDEHRWLGTSSYESVIAAEAELREGSR